MLTSRTDPGACGELRGAVSRFRDHVMVNPTNRRHDAHAPSQGSLEAPVVPGYVLGALLGRGASGSVWAATVEGGTPGPSVAVKVLATDGGGASTVGAGGHTAAAERQLAVGQRVQSEHLVPTHARVDLPDGRVALVLGLADGGSLHDVVSSRGCLPVGEVVTVLTPLATTLAALHRAGVVHADLSPGNVLFARSGRPMLCDLTSAQVIDGREDEPPVGTAGFIAPEVLAGALPSPASDVWALGALLWYARTGGSEPPGWVGWPRGRQATEEPGGSIAQEIAEITAAVGPELRPVLLRMLASDPRSRPTAAAAAVSLYRAAEASPVQLVGRQVDLAAAVTNRLRREAAETRSRAQLRAAQRVADRTDRRRRWAARIVPTRLRSLLERQTSRHPGRAGQLTQTRAGRVVVAGVAGLLLVAGVLAVAIGGVFGHSGLSAERVAATVSTPDLATAHPAAAPSTSSGSPGSLLAPSPPPAPATSSGLPASAPSAATGVAGAAGATAATGVAVAADPVGVLQALADARAAALEAADRSALTAAERSGSPADLGDAATVAQMKATGQRYAGLGFTVRRAVVRAVTATTATLEAVVDRGPYVLVDADGSRESVPAATSGPLVYHLSVEDGAWRMVSISAS